MKYPPSEYAAALLRQCPSIGVSEAARRLRKEHPLVYPSVNRAMRAVQYVRGADGGAQRKSRMNHPDADLLVTPITRKKYMLPVAKSVAEEWKPIELRTPCTVLILADLHLPYHDPKAIQTAVAYAKKHHKINVLLLNGDFCDFYGISRFDKDPERMGVNEELKMQRALLASLAKAFPKCRRIFKIGNHESRFRRFLNQRAPELAGVPEFSLENALWLGKTSFELVDDVPVMAGHLTILHGHELRASSSVNPARAAFLKTNTSCLIGHLHRTSSHSESNMWHKEVMTWSTGCLCDMHPEYARINKWNLGFAVVEVDKDKIYNVFNYRIGENYQVRTA